MLQSENVKFTVEKLRLIRRGHFNEITEKVGSSQNFTLKYDRNMFIQSVLRVGADRLNVTTYRMFTEIFFTYVLNSPIPKLQVPITMHFNVYKKLKSYIILITSNIAQYWHIRVMGSISGISAAWIYVCMSL